jgi:heat shock protein HslJ
MVDESVAVPDRALEGTQWRLDGVIDGDTASSVPNGLASTLQLDGGTLTVVGCNTYQGTYTVSGATITVGSLATSGQVRPCSTAGNALDQTFQKVLHGDVTYAIDGEHLTLTNGPMALTFQGMLQM